VRRWPPSAAQTARAVLPHAAFTKTHELRCKEKQTPSGPFLRGFGATQADVGLQRQFHLTEKVALRFPSELFNIFNHPNFGPPTNSLTSPPSAIQRRCWRTF